MLRSINIPLPHSLAGGVGGTLAYYEYYSKLGVVKSFDTSKTYPHGTLIGRQYRDVKDQGHVGVIIDLKSSKEQYVLQAIPDAGVNIKYTLVDSHAGWYYEYVVLPENWLVNSS